MSLLLQALQRASKHRDGDGTEPDPGGTPREPELGELPEAGSEPPLSLSDADELFEPQPETDSAPELALAPVSAPEPQAAPSRPPERPVLRPAGTLAGSAHAASILRASEARGTGWLDWVRDRPVHATLIFAAIFAVFYIAYLYLAINHPGVLRGEFPWSSTPRRALSKRPVSAPPVAPALAPAVVGSSAGDPGAPRAAQGSTLTLPPAPAASDRQEPGAGDRPLTGLPQAQTQGVQPLDKPLAGMPAPAQKPPAQKPLVRAPQAPATRDTAEREPRSARRDAPARRSNTVDIEATTLEDSVAVRPPPALPTAPGRTLMQAWEALQQGRYAEARGMYQEVMQADPQNVDALLGLATIAARDGNTEEAGRHYARALELEPRNAAAQAGLISIIGQADPQLSETRLKQLIAREPSAFLYFALGNLYARQGLWAQAQPGYFQAYELQPDNPDYAYNLAVGLEHLGQPKLALNYYRRALELSSLKGHAGFDQARVQERIGQLAARVGSQ